MNLRHEHRIGSAVRLGASALLVLAVAAASSPGTRSATGALQGNGQIAFDCAGSICVINPDGTGLATLQNTAGGTRPRWSPDGTKLVFQDSAHGAIWLVNADGSNPVELGTGADPSFSADGKGVLYDSGGAIDEIMLADNSVKTLISSGGLTEPAESPDGNKIAYVANGAVGVYDLTGGTSTTPTPGTDRNPAWAPDGSVVYFDHLPSGGGQYSIESIHPDGSNLTTILSNNDGIGVAPSPDGTKFGFYHIGSPLGILVAKIDGTNSTQIPNTGGDEFDPAWRPAYPATITSTATAGPVAVGTTITDSATLAGAPVAGAAGAITFSAYSDSGCSSTPVYTATATVTGNGQYTVTGFAPAAPGSYYWAVSYSGDTVSDTAAASESCGAAGEISTVVTGGPTAWTSGPVSTTEPGTTTVVSDGTSGQPPQFTYNVPNSCSCGVTGSWTFQTTAATSGQVVLPWVYSGFNAYFDVTVGLNAFVTHLGSTTLTSLVAAGPASCCTTPSAGFSYTGTTTLNVLAGDTYGFTMTGGNFDRNAVLQGTLRLLGATNNSWPAASQIPLDGSGNGSATGTIESSGQASWYKFNVAPGEGLHIDLTNLPANYDLALFSDIGQQFLTLNSTSDLQQLSAEFAPSAFSPSAFSPSAFSPSAFSPSAFSPSAFSPSAFSPSAFSPSAFSPSAFSPSAFSPSAFSPSAFSDANGTYESAQSRSLIAVSAADGTSDEHIVANTWNNTGDYYIRVTGRNGAYAPGQQFRLNVTEDVNSCSNLVPQPGALLSQPVLPGGVKTLIIGDFERMTGDTAAMQNELKLFAARSEIGGQIIDLGDTTGTYQSSPLVAHLLGQADAHTACPYAENLAADAIRSIVQQYRTTNPVSSIVIVGDDHAVPFFRYPDASGLGTESNYIPPVADNTPSQASLRLNYFLSQDAYGAQTILHLNGLDLPVPNLPVGRLVETPSQVTGMVAAYISANGAVIPHSSLVTGYDFLASSAQSVESDLSAALGPGATNDQLITNQGVSPSDTGAPPLHSWTASQLATDLLGARHDLIFLAGHFSANNTLAADYTTTLNSTDLAASNVNLTNSIVFSAGCHSGYNIVGEDAIPGVTQTTDWVGAFAQKGATLIAGTGYQYGDTDFLAYSAKLYANFAHQLRIAPGAIGVGNALFDAKTQYLNDTTQLSGIDEKALLESTLYGLPMLNVNMPAGGASAPVHAALTAPVSPQLVGSNPGNFLGLESSDVDYKPSLTAVTKTLTAQNNTAVTATYLHGDDGVTTSPGSPTLPLFSADVTVPNQVLRGVGFLGGSYTDQTHITPLTGEPTTELGAPHAPFASSTFYPEKLWTLNYFGGIENNTTSTRLQLTPAQYESDAPGSLTDDQRQYSDVKLRLFYSSNITTYGGTSTPALAAPPSISRVDATSSGGTVTFSAHVVGDPSAGIQDVWVTWTDGSGTWQSHDLMQDTTDTTLWTYSLSTSSPIVFMVQAVNGVGLVTLDDNAGSFYQPNSIQPALAGASTLSTTSLSLTAPSSGSFGSSLPVSATLTGPAGGISGKSVTFHLGGTSVTGVTGSGGTATSQVPLTAPPASYQLTVGFGGDATYAGSSASAAVAIAPLGTALTLSGNPSPVLVGSDTGVSATLTSGGSGVGQKTVAFVLTPASGPAIVRTATTNFLGVAALGAVASAAGGTYSVQAFFGSGAVGLSPDAVYGNSSSGTSHLVLTPLAVSSIGLAAASPTSAAAVSWKVTFTEPVTGLTAANFSLVRGGSISGAGNIAVGGSGAVYTVTASTGSGIGTLGLNLTSTAAVTDGAGNGLLGTATGAVYSIVATSPTSFPGSVTCSNATYRGVTIAGNVTVPAGKTCTLISDQINGNTAVGTGSSLLDVASVVAGNLSSAGASWVDLHGGDTVKGNVSIQGTTSIPPAALGDGATANDLCDTQIAGNLQVTASTAAAPFMVGAAPDCLTALAVAGNMAISSNVGKVAIGPARSGAGNVVSGSISVQSNTGGGTLTKNKAGNNCTLGQNKPGIVGSGNTAGGKNACNVTG